MKLKKKVKLIELINIQRPKTKTQKVLKCWAYLLKKKVKNTFLRFSSTLIKKIVQIFYIVLAFE
jgi:hypothetical protein